jgi:hypothetical protein
LAGAGASKYNGGGISTGIAISDAEDSAMQHFGVFAVAIAFWIFLAVAAVAGIVADYKKRQFALEPIRAAIERGQPIDPAVVERLMAPEPRGPGLDPLHLRVGGIITVASGIGVAILAFFVARVLPVTFYPVLGAAVVALCVGAGLICAARVVERHPLRSGRHGN